MVLQPIKCIICGSESVVKNGTQASGRQRLICKDCGKSFQNEYTSEGAKPETKLMVIKMSLNGSGIRDISRVLGISPNTTIDVLKKLKIFSSTSTRNIKTLKNE